MKLHRIALRHYRGIEERCLELAPEGVTLVTGPNEIGKSSFAEALSLLFDEVDSTRKQRVRDVKPAHRDTGSEIEVELSVGPYRITYAKRFHRSPYTRLQVHEPRVENYTGREAHDRALEILENCIDTDLWKALRVQQGESLYQEALGDCPGLATALDAAAGVAAEGERERSLLEAARQECERYFTPGGRERIEIRRARERAEATAQAASACEARLARLEAAVEREALLAREIEAATSAERESEAALRAAEQRHEQLRALRETCERSESARELALAREREAQGAWKQRRQLIGSHAAARAEVEALLSALEEDAPSLVAARGERAHAEANRDRARQAQERCEREQETRHKDVAFHRGRSEHAELARRLARIETAEAAHAEARAALEALPDLAPASVDAIRDAELSVERARARLDAEGPRVRVEAERELELELDGRRLRIAPGEVVEERLAEFLSLALPGLAYLSVMAGAGAAEQRKRFEEAETQLRTRCVEAGVADHAGAVQALGARREAARRLREAEATARESLGESSRQALHSLAARLADRIERYPRERDPEIPLAPDLEAASAALEAASEAASEARRSREEAESRWRSVTQRAERLERACSDTDLRLRLAREQLAELEARLAAAREDTDDLALEQTAERVAAAAREAEAAAREAAHVLAACEPDAVERALEDASRSRSEAARRLRDAREEQREVRGLIAGQGDEGLHEQHELLRAESLAARREHASLARRAAAARLLYDTLSEERESARAGYAEPLRRHIEALGRELFGADFGVTLSEDLEVVRRQHAGLDLAEQDLSAGAREQLAILQRLALALAVSDDEGIPVLLDDALGHADPTRRAAVTRLLEQVGKRCQIIVFACDPERYRDLSSAHVVALD